MDFGEKDVKKISIIIIVAALIILSVMIVLPILVSVIGGLLLAYVFMPVYKIINRYVKNKNASASLVVIIIVVSLLVFLWFVTPLVIRQSFDFLVTLQKVDMTAVVKTLFPSASTAFVTQLSLTLNNVVSSAFSSGTSSLSDFITSLPNILLDFFILGFVFFFAIRDSDKLVDFAKTISPLSEAKEKIVVKRFKDMTSAIIYGWIIVGIIQGILAGIGFFLFGVQGALVLTLLAIFLSIIPFLGPAFVWVPVSVYLLITGNVQTVIGYVIYNLLIVSLIDNIMRSYIISKRTDISPAIILVGMIGGIFVFGVVGIVVGPLILSYLLTLLESFKDKSIYVLFA